MRLVRTAAVIAAALIGLLAAGSPEAGANPLAPSEPRNLRATNGETVTLVWDPPEQNDATVTGYRVYRGTTSGALDLRATTEAQRFADQVGAGEVYYYAVSAVSVGGSEGRRSPEVRAGSLVASAPAVHTITTTGSGEVRRVRLAWHPPDYSGAAPITGYRVYTLGGELLGSASGDARELTVMTRESQLSFTAVNAYGEGRHAFISAWHGCENLNKPENQDCWG